MTSPRSLAYACVILALGLAGCLGRAAGGPGSFGPDHVTVRAQNFHPDHVTFYYYRGASKRRLGDVMGGRTKFFTIPWNSGAEISFEVDMFDRQRCRTPSSTIFPGEQARLWLRFDQRLGERQCDFRVEPRDQAPLAEDQKPATYAVVLRR